ncbi:MAG: monovalent cation/H(+) antiporter subunit G [Balneolaceae bacterium]|nr:monovalent cation/H(+) antiporter subunit G [Balneolaceae bacterium]
MSDFSVIEWAAAAFIVLGIGFMLVGSIGVIRLPDFYSRTHAASKTDTLGILLVIVGLMILEGFTINMGKLAFVLIFVALANPIGSHALARAAMESGLKPLLFRKEEWDGTSVIADSEGAGAKLTSGAELASGAGAAGGEGAGSASGDMPAKSRKGVTAGPKKQKKNGQTDDKSKGDSV